MKAQLLKMIFIYLLWATFSSAYTIQVFADGNETIKSFRTAKKMITKIYLNHSKTFYCGCHYSDKTIDRGVCGFISRKNSTRAKRVEWEHVVPAHYFGKSYKEWKFGHSLCKTKSGKSYKGRRCVAKIYPEFKRMEADLYNIVPAIGEINRARSNYPMNLIAGENRKYGVCDIEVENKTIEPTENIRGDIARTYFYMDWAYPDRGIVSNRNRKLFQTWNNSDPVDTWECLRVDMIFKSQGNQNPFVSEFCTKIVSRSTNKLSD
jgi:deoxyribonuclease I